MTRVLHVTAVASGGVVAHVRQVCELLKDAGIKVAIAAPPEVELSVEGCPRLKVPIGARPSFRDPVAIFQLRKLGRLTDVIHAHGLRAGALCALAISGMKTPPRLIVTLHNMPLGSRSITAVSRVLGHIVARKSQVVLGVSPDLVAWMDKEGAKSTRLALIPPPSGKMKEAKSGRGLRRDLGLASDEVVILTVARCAPQKGLDMAVEACRILRRTMPSARPWVWLVAGDGPGLEDLRRSAEGLPIRFLGRREDVPELLEEANVFVSTSLWEGQPVAIQEALVAGVPVVATDVGGTRCVVETGGTLVEANPQSIAGALSPILCDPAREAQLRHIASRRGQNLPTLQQVLEQLKDVYTNF
ncbi:MAG: glycosyltransferase family 4 protein [Actinomycetaceae bacterium]|nr:glycosyltransferase family 4 protein [Actinomycetaceae bacterium]